MFALVDYKSDDDNDCNDNSDDNSLKKKIISPVISSNFGNFPSISTTDATKSKFQRKSQDISISARKKIKKLETSFLPVEIQNALARGSGGHESDSDDDVVLHTTSLGNGSGGLLAMLPKPKADGNFGLSSHAKGSSIENSAFQTSYAQNTVDDRKKLLDEASRKNCIDSFTVNSETDRCNGFNGDCQNPVLSREHLQNPKAVPSLPRMSVTSAPDVSIPSGNIPSIYKATTEVNVNPPFGDRSLAFSKSSQGYYQTSEVNNQQFPLTYQNQESYAPSAANTKKPPIYQEEIQRPAQFGGKSSRKRDRDIQQELLNGNVSAVGSATILDITAPKDPWDASQYAEQQKRQAELLSMFNFGQQGEKGSMVAQPTKLQNRKHQINSLAFSAAQMEMELLDAKGARMKTKSETQAKYGW